MQAMEVLDAPEEGPALECARAARLRARIIAGLTHPCLRSLPPADELHGAKEGESAKLERVTVPYASMARARRGVLRRRSPAEAPRAAPLLFDAARPPSAPRQDERFSLTNKLYGQYFQLYYQRLMLVSAPLKAAAQQRWPGIPRASPPLAAPERHLAQLRRVRHCEPHARRQRCLSAAPGPPRTVRGLPASKP